MRIIYISAIALLFSSCAEENIVDKKEVSSFLQGQAIKIRKEGIDKEMEFWTRKLESDQGNFVYESEIAGLHLASFHLTGDISSLLYADSLMMRSAKSLNFSDPEMLQAMSQLSVTKHQFAEAFALNERARERAASPFLYSLIRFDTDMELGRYRDAEESLSTITDENSFHYLIRKAKQEDHHGDLESAIALMESALKKVQGSGNPDLLSWTLSNLGDMYGHAGRIQESYQAYVTVLQRDPAYLYALKGIAWIAYSHDKDVDLARSITSFLMKHNSLPDHYLFLAELAEYEGDEKLNKRLVDSFIGKVSDGRYGDMYNKYLIELFSDDPDRIEDAFRIATKEVDNRPTPETFSLLSWVHYKKGEYPEAARVYLNHVSGKTSEPEPLMKGYYILNKTGYQKEAESLRKSSLEAAYELGPVTIGKLTETSK